MSGRPRTTSFAESCKPAVPQPSAFGNMKVSSEYINFPKSHLPHYQFCLKSCSVHTSDLQGLSKVSLIRWKISALHPWVC